MWSLADFLWIANEVFREVLVWISRSFQFVYDNPVLLLVLCLAIAGIIMRIVRHWLPGF